MNASAPFPPQSTLADALAAQRDAIAAAHRHARLREDCGAAKLLAEQAKALTKQILRSAIEGRCQGGRDERNG